MPFNQILGQDQPVRVLRQSLKNGGISHAYLFYGPDSVGKKLAAVELAKALNCLEAPEGDNCGVCDSCRKIDQRIHPDFFLLEAEKKTPTSRDLKIPVESVRELQKKLAYLPYEGKTKVAIIDGAEWMNPQAANTLLKTLEEPPQSTLLILICGNPFLLLPTLVSRCQSVRFNPLQPDVILSIINRHFPDDEESPEERSLRAARAKGSVNRALDLEENTMIAAGQRDELLRLIAGVSFKEMDRAFKWSKTWARKTQVLLPLMEELIGLLRDLAVLRVQGNDSAINNKDLSSPLSAVARQKSLTAIFSMFEAVRDTQRALAGNANAQLALENLLIRFSETQKVSA